MKDPLSQPNPKPHEPSPGEQFLPTRSAHTPPTNGGAGADAGADPAADPALVGFLQHYRPIAPTAAPDLESRLLSALDSLPRDRQRGSTLHSWSQWAMGGAIGGMIAASLLAVWTSQRFSLTAQNPDSAELVELETFVVSSWQGTVETSNTFEFLPVDE